MGFRASTARREGAHDDQAGGFGKISSSRPFHRRIVSSAFVCTLSVEKKNSLEKSPEESGAFVFSVITIVPGVYLYGTLYRYDKTLKTETEGLFKNGPCTRTFIFSPE